MRIWSVSEICPFHAKGGTSTRTIRGTTPNCAVGPAAGAIPIFALPGCLTDSKRYMAGRSSHCTHLPTKSPLGAARIAYMR